MSDYIHNLNTNGYQARVFVNVQEASTEQLWSFIKSNSDQYTTIYATVAIKSMDGFADPRMRGVVHTFRVTGYGNLVGDPHNGKDFLQVEIPMHHSSSNVLLSEVLTIIAISEIPF